MQDKKKFDPEKVILIDFKIIKEQLDSPEVFDYTKVIGHQLENTLQLSFNLEEKLAKADFTVSIKTDSKGINKIEATGNFHLMFIYRIDNIEELTTQKKNNRLNLDSSLANTLSSVTYSTTRGILLTKLQGTELQNFILPIINANKLLKK